MGTLGFWDIRMTVEYIFKHEWSEWVAALNARGVESLEELQRVWIPQTSERQMSKETASEM
jgi:hypothetical protein